MEIYEGAKNGQNEHLAIVIYHLFCSNYWTLIAESGVWPIFLRTSDVIETLRQNFPLYPLLDTPTCSDATTFYMLVGHQCQPIDTLLSVIAHTYCLLLAPALSPTVQAQPRDVFLRGKC